MRSARIIAWACLMALTLCAPLPALQGRPPASHPDQLVIPPLQPFVPPRPVRMDLAKGATLLVIEGDELPLVDGSLIFRGGRRHESAKERGLAELMIDALREGGTHRTTGAELDRWLDSHAATIDLRLEEDALRIDFSCVATDVGSVLEYIGELLMIPAYSESELAKSRTRLISQIAGRAEDPAEAARRLLDELCYGEGSQTASRDRVETVRKATREHLLSFHHSVFGADRLIVGATGAVSPGALAARLDPILERLPRLGPLEASTSEVFRRPSRTRIYLHDRPGLAQAEVRLAAPGTRRRHPDYVPLYLWSYVMGAGGTSNRMMVRLRTELGLIYQGGLFFAPGWTRSGRLLGNCRTSHETVGAVVRNLLDLLDEARSPIPRSELEAVRRRLQNAIVFEVDRPEEVLERAMDAELYGHPTNFWEQRDEQLAAVTREEVAAAVQRYLDPDRLVLLVVGPAESIAPQLESLGEIVVIGER